MAEGLAARLKQKLMFTGWLQYLPTGMLAGFLFLIAGIGALVGGGAAARVVLAMAALTLAIFLFDLITVKWKLHPPERLSDPRRALDVFELMRARRSCRSFQTRKLREEDLGALLAAVEEELGMAGPCFERSRMRLEYVSAPIRVWPVVNATEFLVAIAPSEYDRRDMIEVGYHLQRVVLAATRRGLATCWIGPGGDQASIRAHLGPRFDEERDHVVCLCAIGYKSSFKPLMLRLMQSIQRHRLPLAELFFLDRDMRRPLRADEGVFSSFAPVLEACRWSPSSYNAQPTRCVARFEGEGDGERLAGFDFVATTESRYYAPLAAGIWCADWAFGCEGQGLSGGFAALGRGDAGSSAGASTSRGRYELSWLLDEPLETAGHAAKDR